MARRVFFSFYYEMDIWRANQVRNSWVTQDREAAGFWDASLWEKAKKEGDLAIKRMINSGLQGTSVTAVLIGSQTYSRRWVRYEVAKSFERGNGLLGLFIHKLKNEDGKTDIKGNNPFDYFYFRVDDDKRKINVWEFIGQKWETCQDVSSVSLSDVSYDFGGLKEGPLSKIFSSFDWMDDNGYKNFGTWVEKAAKKAGR